MFNSKWIIIVFILTILFFSENGRAFPATGVTPLDQLKKSVDEILHILKNEELKLPERSMERQQQILKVVYSMFDFRAMAKSSLGKNWKAITPEEQERFVGLFSSLVERRYIGKIDAYTDQEVIYKKQLVKENKAMIYTSLINKGTEIPIVYKLTLINKGTEIPIVYKLKVKEDKWLIYDMKIENVSLILNYRRDFESIIRKEKFAGLVERMTRQIEESQPQQ
jgi:phospholipid transport system substrate-binding protein